jgi:hypothetical protein
MELGPHETTDVTVEDVIVYPPLIVIIKSKVIVLLNYVSTTTFLQSTLFVSQFSVATCASLTAPAGVTVPKVTDVTSQ